MNNFWKKKYEKALAVIPASGGGGAHGAMLGIANYGARADLSADEMYSDIQAAWHGERDWNHSDAVTTIAKAIREAGYANAMTAFTGKQMKRRQGNLTPLGSTETTRRLVHDGWGATEADIVASSPIAIPDAPVEQFKLLLETLYKPEEKIFLGCNYDMAVFDVGFVAKTVTEKNIQLIPQMTPNPFTGESLKNDSGKDTQRQEVSLASFRFAVAEMDEIPVGLMSPEVLRIKAAYDADTSQPRPKELGWIRSAIER